VNAYGALPASRWYWIDDHNRLNVGPNSAEPKLPLYNHDGVSDFYGRLSTLLANDMWANSHDNPRENLIPDFDFCYVISYMI